MQHNIEPSLGCVKKKASHLRSQESGNAMEDFAGIKDDINALPAYFADSDNLVNKKGAVPVNQDRGVFYQQEVLTWPVFYPDVQMPQDWHVNVFDNHYHPMNREDFYPVEHRIHYMPYKLVPQDVPPEFQLQEFQYFVVIDFEATCDKDKNPHPQEIIEFPSVLVNSFTGQLEACFQTYVKPAYHQLLTDFCKELTGIQQTQVDRGVSLSEALLMHDKWLEDKGIKHQNFAVVTWSNWDCRVMLDSECRFKGIQKPAYFNKWINLKVPFQEVFGGIRCNLKDAVQLAGLSWEGRAHCGLDDARNTARLLSQLMCCGFRFSITNSIAWSSTEKPSLRPNCRPDSPTTAAARSPRPKEMAPGQSPQFCPERAIYCFCGAKSSKCLVRKPGPTQGRSFFGCGNWSASRRSVCDYFVWASP